MSIACKPKSKVQAADRLVYWRRRSAPSGPGAPPRLLTVIVPVYNEAATVRQLLWRVAAAPYHKQLIVVDDGSTGDTAQALEAWRRYPGFEVLRHATNRGKGAAIRTGLKYAEAPLAIIQGADLEYDPQEYWKLVEPLLSADTMVVYGSRRLGRRMTWHDLLNPFYHGVSLLNVLVGIWYRVRITDEATCYKAFRTDVLRWMQLECRRFEFCPEVTAKACRMGLAIREVPIAYCPRTLEQGKKIRFRDWVHAVFTLWRWRNWRPPAGWDRTCTHACRIATLRGSSRLNSREARDRAGGGSWLSGSVAAGRRTSCDAPRPAESVKRSEMR